MTEELGDRKAGNLGTQMIDCTRFVTCCAVSPFPSSFSRKENRMSNMGKILAFQSQFQWALVEEDFPLLANHFCKIVATWPDLATCPIHLPLIKRAKAALINAGWSYQTDGVKGVRWTSPSGREQNSHHQGKPKTQLIL